MLICIFRFIVIHKTKTEWAFHRDVCLARFFHITVNLSMKNLHVWTYLLCKRGDMCILNFIRYIDNTQD